MSGRRGNLHIRLNHAEESRIKKELERLLKHPQRDFGHATADSRPGSYSPKSHSDQIETFSGITNNYSTQQSVPDPPDYRDANVSDHVDEKPDVKARTSTQSSRASHRNTIQESRGHTESQANQSYIHLKTVGLDSHPKGTAIASAVGTTKCISVYPRPEPPSKPRSYIQQMSKPRISTKPMADKKGKKSKPLSVKPSKGKTPVDVGTHFRSSPDSNATSSSSDSDSEDSDSSNSIRNSTKRKKPVLKKDHNLSRSKKEQLVKKGNSTHLTPDMPGTDLLSVVTETPLTLSQGAELKQEPKEGKSIHLASPTKAAARSVDEIIASLRSPQVNSASDLMIKLLMESVLGVDYNITFGEAVEEKAEKESEKKPPSTEPAPPQQTVDEAATQTDNSVLEGCASPRFNKDIKVFIDVDTAAQEENAAVKELLTTEEEDKSDLKASSQISISDIIHVRGDAAPLARRENGKIHHPSLLATWEPRTKQHGGKTIHHFCTVSPSFLLPSYLQLASRVHHTVDRTGHHVSSANHDLPVTAREDRLMNDWPNGEEKEGSDATRFLEVGLPVSSVPLQNQRGSVVSMPPHNARSLEEWQKIAEYYVEGPRMELVGEKVLLKSDNLKMFWAPAPPKFSAPRSQIQKLLFEKYEVTESL
ncbi:uncharacterized protein LOC128504312 [Spea bombifrons]|uniref:uncharacterized protein LOC128504312 n=1 Tax=Spea bombifrons TaxID=233779 RepID=UPI00234A4823|nr:uncharacterized protein LOC128504312 [Spea bombifrons]